MKRGWVLGWAVPASWFAAEAARVWPEDEHVCVPAAPDWRGRLEAADALERVGGYSLGALLLLRERGWLQARGARVGLLAPCWAFPREAGRGGRVARAQVRALAHWVRRDSGAARADFYLRAGLAEVCGAVESAELLAWGLAQLETETAEPGLPSGWFAVAGAEDVLLDAAVLAAVEPGVRVVAGAGHAPGALMTAWAEAERARKEDAA